MKKFDFILITLIVVVSVFSVFVYSKLQMKDITIIDGSKKIVLQTPLNDMDKIFKKCNIVLNEKDKVIPSYSTKLSSNTEITIIRAKSYKIDFDGKLIEVFSTNNLAIDIIKEYNIQLGIDDIIIPSKNAVINDGDTISIIRVEKSIVEEKKIIPFNTIIKMTTKLKEGETKKLSEGKNGLAMVTFSVTTEDGVETSRDVINNNIINESESEVIEKGIDKLYVTSRGMPFRYSTVLIMKASAYDLSYESCGKYPDNPEYGITFSGTKAHPGVVAVDPKVIPLKSKIYVESLDRTRDYGFASAEDTGSAIKGNRIDLFIGNNRAAMNYGRRNVRVYILDDVVTDDLIKGYGK